MEIADWRQKIDGIDEQIVKLLCERAAAAAAIGELKLARGTNIYEPDREQNVLAHVAAANTGEIPQAELADIYERIMDVMRGLQRKKA
ncbi:MAG: chorismate mutase [Terriglobus sp.]|jgi:chorismate mutase